jgi:hypothetical protein
MSNSPEPGVGAVHLRTGALPARHSCGLAQPSCFPFRISPSAIKNSGWFRHGLRPRLRRDWLSRNLFRSFWNERFEQRFEARTQAQLLTFLLKHFVGIGCRLQRVAEVRQPHEPEAVRCPIGGGKPGEKCELSTGLPRTEPHPDRRWQLEK